MPKSVIYVATCEVKLTIRAATLEEAKNKAQAELRTLDKLYSARVTGIGEYVK